MAFLTSPFIPMPREPLSIASDARPVCDAGDTLFTVADLNQVWIKADVYEEQLPQIRQGQEVEITAESLPNRTLHGHVDFIEPAANPQTRTVPVHVHVANRRCACCLECLSMPHS